MRIAFIDVTSWAFNIQSAYSMPLGGSQSALCYLSEQLTVLGHDVTLLNGCTQVSVSRGVTCAPLARASAALWKSLDVVVVQNWSKLARDLQAVVGKQTRLVLWTQHAHDQPAMRTLADPQFRDAHHAFVFVSDWQRRQYENAFALPSVPCSVLRNAIAPAFEQVVNNILPLPRHEGEWRSIHAACLDQAQTAGDIASAKRQPPVLAYTSTPFRGLETLIEVFPQIRAAVPGATLKVFSSMQVYQMAADQDRSRYGALYEKCRTTPGVEYIGSAPQPQLAQALREVSVLAYPNSFAETSCIAVMEAMASGCHVVTSDLAALPETTAGFASLVAMADPATYRERFVAATVAALTRLQDRHSQASATLAEQLKFIHEQCTWRHRAQQWHTWLTELCGSQHHCPPPHPQTARDRHIRPSIAAATG